MSLRVAYKAAGIAKVAEREIKRRAHGMFLENYKRQYAWGTEVGNHIFDTVATRSKEERLNEADDFGLSLLYLIQQAEFDENTGAINGFTRILFEMLPEIKTQLSVGVAAEITSFVFRDAIENSLLDEANSLLDDIVEQAAGEQSKQASPVNTENTRQQVKAKRTADAERQARERALALERSEAERRKAKEAKKAEDGEVNPANYADAQIAIKYRQEAEEAWAQAQGLPADLRQKFLENLDEDPRQDVSKLLSSLEEEHKTKRRPFNDEAANDALEQAGTIAPEAAVEFKKVYDTFGATIAVTEILEKIEREFGPSERTMAATREKEAKRREEQSRLEKKERTMAAAREKEAKRRVEQSRLEKKERDDIEWQLKLAEAKRIDKLAEQEKIKKRNRWMILAAGALFLLILMKG